MTESAAAAAACWLSVLVPTPAYSAIGGALTYSHSAPLPAGTVVRVPLGRREVPGVVWGLADAPGADLAGQIRPLAGVLHALAPLDAHWRALIEFAARYYQRALGEVALAALPPQLRTLDDAQLARRLARLQKTEAAPTPAAAPAAPAPTREQAAALAAIASGRGPFLLHGATGSGKTEVYMQAAQAALAQEPGAQVLVLAPEINLTPQLHARFAARFAPWLGEQAVVFMHSGLTPAQRLAAWLAAHTGRARIVLGTRMAALASLPGLRLIVVDEEHDSSYKQQEGARYSARDLAVYRASLLAEAGCKVVLGSATPSLESWHNSRPATAGDAGGRYQRLSMPARVGAGALPLVRRVDMKRQPRGTLIAAPLLEAIGQRIARGEQSLLLLNRRGWAPVLHCANCDWKSQCPHCSAWRVFHKTDRSLRCHHCGLAQSVPRACPTCGNADITPIGQGTEQLEEAAIALLQNATRPDGSRARIARMDADTTRHKGQLAGQLAHVHEGSVDVLVGTQMIAKGHDFRRVTLVAALNPDTALFSEDFRAAERLFALLMQAAGRAGRDAAHSQGSEMWVQTEHPAHPLFAALKTHDYPGFAAAQLGERQAAGLPPYTHLALLRAESRQLQAALAFLHDAAAAIAAPAQAAAVTLYPPVPAAMQRLAGMERAHMLLETTHRPALQQLLAHWQPQLHALKARHKALARWVIDVDPLSF